MPEFENYQQLSEDKKLHREEKTQYQRKDEFTAEEFYDRTGIWQNLLKLYVFQLAFSVLKMGKELLD